MTHTTVQLPTPRPRRLPRPAPKLTLGLLALYALPIAAVLGVLALVSPLIAGAAFGVLFVVLAFWQPLIALTIIFALVPFQYHPHGLPVKLSVSEFCLIMMLPIGFLQTVIRRRPLRMGPMLWPVLLYLACALISTLPHMNKIAFVSLAQIVAYFICAILAYASYVGDAADLRLPFDAAVGMCALLAIPLLATRMAFPAQNKNAWGALMGAALVIAVELWLSAKTARRKMWLLIAAPLIAGALFLSLSRGGWLEALSGIFVVFLIRRRFGALLKLALVLAPVVALLWVSLPKAQQHYAVGFSAKRQNINARWQTIDTSREIFEAHPFFGVGVALRKTLDATDVVMVTLAETGVQGLLAFGLIYFVLLYVAWWLHKRLPPTDPRFSLAALGAALMVGRFVHGMVDEYWIRGSIIWACGAVGMMMAAYYEVRSAGRVKARAVPAPHAQP